MSEPESRRHDIVAAITRELQRQALTDAARIDVTALAEAVERALDQPEAEEIDELSREPDDLNAANDI